jgi:hypothetical protein
MIHLIAYRCPILGVYVDNLPAYNARRDAWLFAKWWRR